MGPACLAEFVPAGLLLGVWFVRQQARAAAPAAQSVQHQISDELLFSFAHFHTEAQVLIEEHIVELLLGTAVGR